MNTMQKQNADFNRAFKRPVREVPAPLPQDEIAVSVELIREEFVDELVPALLAGDLVESADACIDLLYVTYGLLNRLGIDAEPLYDEVHSSNMSKLGADGQPIIAGPNDPDGIFEGRVKKGPNYFRPNLAKLIDAQIRSAELVDHGGFEDH